MEAKGGPKVKHLSGFKKCERLFSNWMLKCRRSSTSGKAKVQDLGPKPKSLRVPIATDDTLPLHKAPSKTSTAAANTSSPALAVSTESHGSDSSDSSPPSPERLETDTHSRTPSPFSNEDSESITSSSSDESESVVKPPGLEPLEAVPEPPGKLLISGPSKTPESPQNTCASQSSDCSTQKESMLDWTQENPMSEHIRAPQTPRVPQNPFPPHMPRLSPTCLPSQNAERITQEFRVINSIRRHWISKCRHSRHSRVPDLLLRTTPRELMCVAASNNTWRHYRYALNSPKPVIAF